MSGDRQSPTESVVHGGKSFRLESRLERQRGQITTTLSLGGTVVVSKTTPCDPAVGGVAAAAALGAAQRALRARLVAGDLDPFIEAAVEPTPAPIASSPVEAAQRRSRPGRWAVKIKRVESPFHRTGQRPVDAPPQVEPPARAEQDEGWNVAVDDGASAPARRDPTTPTRPEVSRSMARREPTQPPERKEPSTPKVAAAPTEPSTPKMPAVAPTERSAPKMPAVAPTERSAPKMPAVAPTERSAPKMPAVARAAPGAPVSSAPPTEPSRPPAPAPSVAFAAPEGRVTIGPYLLLERRATAAVAARTVSGTESLYVLRTRADGSLRTLEELRTLMRMEHAAIVPIADVGQDGELSFWVEPLLTGVDGLALLERCAELRKPLPVDIVALIVKEVARGVAAVHSGMRAHGSIGAKNVIVGLSGEVRLRGLGEASGSVAEDVVALGTLLLTLLGREGTDTIAAARAPFVPPALLQVAQRARGEKGARDPFRSAEGVRDALGSYLERDAPRIDAARIGRLVTEMMPLVESEDAARRVAWLRAARDWFAARALEGSKPPKTATPVIEPEKPRDLELTEGTLVDGRYRVRRLCGRGGMGWVYEAEHQGIGKRVAIKILHPIYSRAPDVAERFRREARAASKIGHPHIIDVLDFGTTEEGCLYIAMELLEGRDLGALLEELGSLPAARALQITLQTCRALAAAHAVGIVHRDLKPENIFLLDRPGGVDFVKVLDFGIAKHVTDPTQERLTRPNIALGTPEYMAPEQVAGKTDPRSDIYSVGAMLFEMLVGAPPFEGEHYLEVFRRKAVEDPPAPSSLRRELGPEIDALVLRALARDPAVRHQTMDELAQAIQRLLEVGKPG